MTKLAAHAEVSALMMFGCAMAVPGSARSIVRAVPSVRRQPRERARFESVTEAASRCRCGSRQTVRRRLSGFDSFLACFAILPENRVFLVPAASLGDQIRNQLAECCRQLGPTLTDSDQLDRRVGP